MQICFDCEFTGLHKDTTLISIGFVAEDGKELYCELTDYDINQVDNWVADNVIENLMFNDFETVSETVGSITFVKDNTAKVQAVLASWLSKYSKVEIWSDCHHYDIVLLHNIFGGAFKMPHNVYYIPFDISTVFKVYGIDPDISREAFIDKPIEGTKHNSLYDARVIRACLDKLQRNKDKYKLML